MPRDNPLDLVYSAASPEELNEAYAAWAADYDRDTIAMGYALPFMITAWVARHVEPGAGPVLDAGCGTGLSGPYLAALGFGEIAGLDSSPDMLKLAESRGVYGDLKQAELGKTLPWPDGRFTAFLSTGVFTEGHAPASGLEELVRVTRPGGHAVFTVRDAVIGPGGFAGTFERLERDGRWTPIEESPPFRAFSIAEPEVLVKTFVFGVI